MRTFLGVLAAGCLAVVGVGAAVDVRQEILDLQSKRAAAGASCDGAGVARYTADDAVLVRPDGAVVRGKQFSADKGSKDCVPNKPVQYPDTLVRQYGDVAVLTLTSRRSEDSERATYVWLKTTNGWKVVARQGSTIDAATKSSFPVVAAGPVDTSVPADADKTLRAALDEVVASNASGDAARSARVSGDDYVRISPTGAIEPKAVVTANMGRNQTGARQPSPVTELQIRRYGPVAITSSQEAITNPSAADQRPNRTLRVFVHRGGKWLLVATHVTKIGARRAS